MISISLLVWLLCVSTVLTQYVPDLSPIHVIYGVLRNADSVMTAHYTLINSGSQAIKTGSVPVTMYFCNIRQIKASAEKDGSVLHGSGPTVTAFHLDGCAHKIVYSSLNLAPGASFSVEADHDFWSVAYTDVMPNWYIQLGNGTRTLISNTDSSSSELVQKNFVDPFDTREKSLRSADDLVEPWTMTDRYNQHEKSIKYESYRDKKYDLIPAVTNPVQIDNNTAYRRPRGVQHSINSTFSVDEHTIEVSIDGSVVITTAGDLMSVKTAHSTYSQWNERGFELPVGLMHNKPRFGYRGFMLDLARHFLNAESIRRQIKLMHRYRLNRLHLHLSDDESWALEIDGIPELTMYGSRQCYDNSQCATYPQLGRKTNDPKSYLTKLEYIALVRFASEHGVTIVPEIELPGHATAAVNAMKMRHDRSSTSAGYVDFRLHDTDDSSEYSSVQYFTGGAMNPCVESTFNFIDTVMKTIKEYHEQAGFPLKLIHLAGDEVANGAWVNSTACKRLLEVLNASADVPQKQMKSLIKEQMLRRIGLMAERENINLAFWEDGLINNTDGKPFNRLAVFPATIDVYGFVWQTVWEWWGGDRAFNLANDDYKVVMAPATHYYLDHSQEPNSNERGFYWATRYSNLEKVFSFRPINYYENIDGTRTFGADITREEWCNPDKCPPLQSGKETNIVGVEAPLFGETISTDDHIDNNAWPRLLAVAERAWNEASWENLNGPNPKEKEQDFQRFFAAIARHERKMLIKLGVKYHLSPPGAKIHNGGAFQYAGESQKYVLLNTEYLQSVPTQSIYVRRENSSTSEIISQLTRDWLPVGSTAFYKTSENIDGKERFSYEVSLTDN